MNENNNMMNGQQPVPPQGQYQGQFQEQGYQQASAYQNPLQYQMNGQPQPPKKSHVGIIMIVLVCVMLLFAVLGVGGFFAYKMFNSQDEDVQEAMKATFAFSDNGAVNEVLRFDELSSKMQEQGTHMDMNFNIDEVDGENIGSPSFDMQIDADVNNCAVDMQGSVSFSGISIDNIECYYDTDSMLLNIPFLYDKAFELDYSGDFESELKDSSFAYLINDDEAIESFAQSIEILKESFENAKEYQAEEVSTQNGFSVISDMFFEKAKKEKIDSMKIDLDGKTVKCKGYRLTLDQDAMEEIVEELINILEDAEFDEILSRNGADMTSSEVYSNIRKAVEQINDFTMDVYLTKGQVAKIDCILVSKDDDTIEINYESTGGEILSQNMTVDMTVTVDGDTDSCTLTRETDNTDDEYNTDWVLSADGYDWKIGYRYDKSEDTFKIDIDADGEIEFVCEGKVDNSNDSYVELVLDNFELLEYGSALLKMNGSLTYGVLEEDVVKPSFETVDVLEMSEYDWMDVIMSIDSTLN